MDYRGPKRKRRPTSRKNKGLTRDGKPDKRLAKNNPTKKQLNAPVIPAEGFIPESKVGQAARKLRTHLKGRVLCIDPSSGSEQSVPGFALFEGQILREVGFLEISRTSDAPIRFKELVRALQDNFSEEVDVLVIEYVPPFMSKPGKGGFRTQGVVNLHRAIGITMGVVPWKSIIQVPPISWRTWVTNNVGAIGSTYKKRDDRDAMALGLTVFHLADLPVFNEEQAILYLRGELRGIGDEEVFNEEFGDPYEGVEKELVSRDNEERD